jgi:hypothetical protein
MGFLDHSTNNIIIDAVLTDKGRQRLAENNGQFSIQFFSLADDEVDYGIIKKFGRIVGKEKIVKNTPIFEAQTKQNSALKYRMLTLPDPTIFKMPSMSLVTVNTSNVVSFSGTVVGGNLATQNIVIKQAIGNEQDLPPNLNDSSYTVYVNDRFVSVSGNPLGSPDPMTKIRAYTVFSEDTGTVSFDIEPVPTNQLTSTVFATYGVSGTITTPVSVVGDQTGLRLDFKVAISQGS